MAGLRYSGIDAVWRAASDPQPFLQQNLLVADPVEVFWTPYDPLDLASGSLDPLGFARGYLALADRLLPSFTTVTTVPRYVSMLCAALNVAQKRVPAEAGLPLPKLRQARLKLMKSYERAWALACGLAARVEEGGPKAVGGLRGIRYVNRRLETLSGREKYVQTGSFNLLSNQVRMGPGVSLEIDRDDDADIQETGTLLVPHLGLIPVRLDVVVHGGPLQVLPRDVGVVQCAAVRATWAAAGRGSFRGDIPRGIMTSLGNQMSANATHHGQGGVVAQVAIEPQMTPWHGALARGQWRRHHDLHPLSC